MIKSFHPCFKSLKFYIFLSYNFYQEKKSEFLLGKRSVKLKLMLILWGEILIVSPSTHYLSHYFQFSSTQEPAQASLLTGTR